MWSFSNWTTRPLQGVKAVTVTWRTEVTLDCNSSYILCEPNCTLLHNRVTPSHGLAKFHPQDRSDANCNACGRIPAALVSLVNYTVNCTVTSLVFIWISLHFGLWLVSKPRATFLTNEKQQQNCDSLARIFPLFLAGCIYHLRILVGSLHCLRPLRLASVTTLVRFYDTLN